MNLASILLGIAGGVLCLEGNSNSNDIAVIAIQATEVTKEAAKANKKMEFATAGVYAVLSRDLSVDEQARKGFAQELHNEQLLLPPLKADTKAEAQEKLRSRIEEALNKREPLRAMDIVGRLVAMHQIGALAPLDANKLSQAVRDLTILCPSCSGTRKGACATCKGGAIEVQKQCARCINGFHPCETCNGSKLVTCKGCGGDGNEEYIVQQKTGGAFKERVQKTKACTACARWWTEFAGKVPCTNCTDGHKSCNTCKATGQVKKKEKCPDCAAGKIACANCNGSGRRTP